MRKLLLQFIALMLLSCSNPQLSFDQFEGNWLRSNDQDGKVTTERWWNENGTMKGQGLTMHGVDTLFFEELSIVLRQGQYYYVVTGINEKPTEFRLTEFSDDYFQFNNPDNPFPSSIRYQFKSDSMFAYLNGSGNSVEFHFGLE